MCAQQIYWWDSQWYLASGQPSSRTAGTTPDMAP
jgi:hypothetical protein